MDHIAATIAPPDFGDIPHTLEKTRPWVRLMSVLAFIAVGFMALAGLFGGIASVANQDPTMAILLVVYPLFALLYLFPAIYLWRYANRIGEFMRDRSMGTLQAALDAQRAFWKFAGIMVIVSFSLGIIMAVVAGMVAASGAFIP